MVLQGVGSLQNRRPVLHILLQGQQVDGQERHAGLRNEKTHHPEPQHRSVNQRRRVLPCRVWGRRARGSSWLPATGKSPVLDQDRAVTGGQETAWREVGGGWKGPVVSPAWCLGWRAGAGARLACEPARALPAGTPGRNIGYRWRSFCRVSALSFALVWTHEFCQVKSFGQRHACSPGL